MEGTCQPETPPLAMDFGCANVLLNRSDSDSDSDSQSVESCRDFWREEEGSSKIWTDEKHKLYLEQLEVSFVKKLHRSMGLVSHCSENNKRRRYVSQARPIDSRNTLEQCGCRESMNHWKSKRHPGVSSCNPVNNSRMMSADVPDLIFHAENRCEEEGTGQNFVDNDNKNKSSTKARAKRLKTTSTDDSSFNQILPSYNSPTTDY